MAQDEGAPQEPQTAEEMRRVVQDLYNTSLKLSLPPEARQDREYLIRTTYEESFTTPAQVLSLMHVYHRFERAVRLAIAESTGALYDAHALELAAATRTGDAEPVLAAEDPPVLLAETLTVQVVETQVHTRTVRAVASRQEPPAESETRLGSESETTIRAPVEQDGEENAVQAEEVSGDEINYVISRTFECMAAQVRTGQRSPEFQIKDVCGAVERLFEGRGQHVRVSSSRVVYLARRYASIKEKDERGTGIWQFKEDVSPDDATQGVPVTQQSVRETDMAKRPVFQETAAPAADSDPTLQPFVADTGSVGVPAEPGVVGVPTLASPPAAAPPERAENGQRTIEVNRLVARIEGFQHLLLWSYQSRSEGIPADSALERFEYTNLLGRSIPELKDRDQALWEELKKRIALPQERGSERQPSVPSSAAAADPPAESAGLPELVGNPPGSPERQEQKEGPPLSDLPHIPPPHPNATKGTDVTTWTPEVAEKLKKLVGAKPDDPNFVARLDESLAREKEHEEIISVIRSSSGGHIGSDDKVTVQLVKKGAEEHANLKALRAVAAKRINGMMPTDQQIDEEKVTGQVLNSFFEKDLQGRLEQAMDNARAEGRRDAEKAAASEKKRLEELLAQRDQQLVPAGQRTTVGNAWQCIQSKLGWILLAIVLVGGAALYVFDQYQFAPSGAGQSGAVPPSTPNEEAPLSEQVKAILETPTPENQQ